MFVVATVFKNEAPLLAEWVQHYLLEGAVHFFMVDHGSTDEPYEQVARHAANITWFRDDRPFFPGVQTELLNEHVLPKVRGGKCWVLVCDVDEYLYAPLAHGTVANVLDAMPPHIQKVWTPWKVFGSNGRTELRQESVVAAFTKRANAISIPFRRLGQRFESHVGVGKTVARRVSRLGVHESETFANNTLYGWGADHLQAHLMARLPSNPLLELNHYMYMSRDYYEQVKCVRGGGQTGLINPKYTMRYFDETEPSCNQVEDCALLMKRLTLTPS
jgi:hypothetical protein